MAKIIIVHNRIRELRLASGLTQAELARRVCVSKNAISSYECGHYSPSLETAFNLAHVFKVSVFPGLFYSEVSDGSL